MSAIWGCVKLDKTPVNEGLAQIMRLPFESYRIDRFAQLTRENVMMGCGIQFIQPEAEREEMPIADITSGIIFAADCFIDNRDELIVALCPDTPDIPDGTLLYNAYLRWRDDAPTHVRGSFAFAVYDTGDNTLTLCADQTFSRSIYYAREGNCVYFSTLIKPILRGRKINPLPNNRWICGYLAQPHLGVLTEPVETAYEGVYKVKPWHFTRFSVQNNESVPYWFPERIPPLRLKNDDEYKKRFLYIMESAAAEVTRTDHETGILLSSGMDSSTVAAFAAPELAKRGKSLFSYTTVPSQDYKGNHNWTSLIDETDGVKAICEMYPNIKPIIDSNPELDSIRDLPRFLSVYEQPFKAFANIPWMEGFTKRAFSEGARVMLTGQTGNIGLSFGDIQTYIKTNFKRGKWLRIVRFARRFSRRFGQSPFFGSLRLLSHHLPYLIPEKLQLLFVRDYLSGTFVKLKTAGNNGIRKRSSAFAKNIPTKVAFNMDSLRSFMARPEIFSFAGEAETKNGLECGVIFRDITKDVRLMEFCLGAPLECFVDDFGVTRRLVRRYMHGRLPERILHDEFRRGVQSADWIWRLNNRWYDYYADLTRVCQSQPLSKYTNETLVASALERFRVPPTENDKPELMKLMYTYITGLFIELNFAHAEILGRV